MTLQAVVEAKEDKGFLCDLGFKDGTKAFVKDEGLKVNQLIMVKVDKVAAGTKMLKCQRVQEGTDHEAIKKSKELELTLAHIKPGMLVHSKVHKVYDNGVEVSFAGGLLGTIFADHCEGNQASSYKVGAKVDARVISVDPVNKRACLSLKESLVQWSTAKPTAVVGQTFDKLTLTQQLYGGSHLVTLGEAKISAFLHKTHAALGEDIKVGTELEKQVRVKEFNWFDGLPIVTMKEELV